MDILNSVLNFIDYNFYFSLFATIPEQTDADTSLVLASILLSLVIIYFASKLGGEICARIDLPPVLGELVGGVIIGTSILGLLVFPEGMNTANNSLIMKFLQFTADVTPGNIQSTFDSQGEIISILSELGVIILLFEIGLESNLKELISVGPQSIMVAVAGVVTPFMLGTLGLTYLFHIDIIPSIFAGAALTATSIGITAKVLAELGNLSSPEGQIIIGAAVLDDILGIIVLAVVASLMKTGQVEVLNIVYLSLTAAVFLIGAIFIGRLLHPVYVKLVNKMKTRGQLLLISLCFAFVLSYIAQIIHLETILGSFAAGLVLAETEKRKELQDLIAPISDIFVPIFFVCVGAKTDLSVLNPTDPSNREGLVLAGFLILVAVIGKVISGFTIIGQSELNKLAIGVGMIPRGEVGLVFVGVGSASGVLSKPIEASIIVMVIFTTFLAPLLLRSILKEPFFTPQKQKIT
ncbi:MAG: cation:proton antiporter [Candidatus Atelocyanobacterium thalassa]|uniref:Sodium/proton antiporter NhaS3, CPA2 family n=1 Tax=Candidatus Atelocyanobacterium thalassa isolate SIO64986 TaxID=1527444 RepID=A0A086CGW6_9CHRO|nr:MAG: sodium/proton antiporter NhaS3, CPA2 family [Candidatus Atelocyanobacterium thalassa isolate SIO64986]